MLALEVTRWRERIAGRPLEPSGCDQRLPNPFFLLLLALTVNVDVVTLEVRREGAILFGLVSTLITFKPLHVDVMNIREVLCEAALMLTLEFALITLKPSHTDIVNVCEVLCEVALLLGLVLAVWTFNPSHTDIVNIREVLCEAALLLSLEVAPRLITHEPSHTDIVNIREVPCEVALLLGFVLAVWTLHTITLPEAEIAFNALTIHGGEGMTTTAT